MNMQVILTQEKCVEALNGETSIHACLTRAKKTEMMDKAKSEIIMCFRDKVLREVSRGEIVASM